eukprot:10184222-Heterocapsa_arctica.AAC.1
MDAGLVAGPRGRNVVLDVPEDFLVNFAEDLRKREVLLVSNEVVDLRVEEAGIGVDDLEALFVQHAADEEHVTQG